MCQSKLSRHTLPRALGVQQLHTVMYHIYTAYLFTCNNIKDIVCMGFLFGAINALVAPQLSMGPPLSIYQILQAAPAMLLWSFSNLLLFNLHNQRNAVNEDALNKPWRPLPSGRLTPTQATRLTYCMYPVILLVSLSIGGLTPCLLEALFCLHYNEWGGAANPWLKNLLNGVGFTCFLAGPLEVVTGHSVCQGKAAIWLSIIAAAITTVSHTQDFRDKEGDKVTGRRTVPLVFGDTNARVVAGLGLTLWPIIACWYWEAGWMGAWALIAGAMTTANLFWNRSNAGDVLTWKMFPLWLLGLMVLPLREGSHMHALGATGQMA